jgi:hypothetical protein
MTGRLATPLIVALISVSVLIGSIINESNVLAQAETPQLGEGVVTRDPSGKVMIRFARGNRLDVDNRSTGPIVVVGWDRDYVEAFAVSDRGAEAIKVGIEDGFSARTIRIRADYAERTDDLAGFVIDQVAKVESMKDRVASLWESRTRLNDRPSREPGSARGRDPQQSVNSPVSPPPLYEPPPPDVQAASMVRPGEVFLEVRVPRQATLDLIKVYRSEVLVYGVDTDVVVDGQRSVVRIGHVRSAEVHTQSGNIEVESVTDSVNLITTSGIIRVKDIGGSLRALSVSGRIEIECARGKVDVNNTNAPIILNGVTGDVTATGTNGNIVFRGTVRSGGQYNLKSLSGSVELELPSSVKGFTATLTSYSGPVENAFQLKSVDGPVAPANTRRIFGRYGNGEATITLDSFDGSVKLTRSQTQTAFACK